MKSTNELMNLIKKAQREEFVDSIREESMDVSELMKDYGFKPSTTIEEGLSRFAEWFLSYYGE